MAVVIGTSAGFVITAPTADPADTDVLQDTRANVTRDTSPSTAVKITEIGWWCNEATEEANFEVGLYAADGTVDPGEAGTLLQVSTTNAKGTGAGWKVVTGLNWTISSSTPYWLGVQLDDTATATNTNLSVAFDGTARRDSKSSQTTLTNPFGGGFATNTSYAIYAVWEAASGRTLASSRSISGTRTIAVRSIASRSLV